VKEEIQRQRDDVNEYAVYRKVHEFVEKILDESTSQKLKKRAKRRISTVYQAKKISREIEYSEDFEDRKQRQDDEELAGGRFMEEAVFTIAGIGAVNSYKKLSNTHYDELLSEVEVFSQLTPENLDYIALKNNYNWSRLIDKKLRDLNYIVEDCRRFSLTSNTRKIIINNYK